MVRTTSASLVRGVHLVVRDGLPATAGNLVTARRLRDGLQRSGVAARILRAGTLNSSPAPAAGDVVHALHAVAAGLPALRWARAAPVVCTFTGTDLTPPRLAALSNAARALFACVAFDPQAAALLADALPTPPGGVRVIPPGVPIPPRPSVPPLAPGGGPLFLLPAGIRPVKDPELALDTVQALRQAGCAARLAIVGPSRDPSTLVALRARLRTASEFARYEGEVDHAEMTAWYARADVVLNTSRQEGLANSVLEAMAAARPVLATDIAGNRAAITHDVDGWLAPREAFAPAALQLAQDHELRERLGKAARASVARRFSPVAELRAHLLLYQEAAASAGRA